MRAYSRMAIVSNAAKVAMLNASQFEGAAANCVVALTSTAMDSRSFHYWRCAGVRGVRSAVRVGELSRLFARCYGSLYMNTAESWRVYIWFCLQTVAEH